MPAVNAHSSMAPVNAVFGGQRFHAPMFREHNDYWHTWPERKVVVFAIPKVGTSSMRVFTLSDNLSWRAAKNPPLKLIQSWFFALLMRDPLARLISAFEDEHHKHYIRSEFSHRNSQFPECGMNYTMKCTFERFVEAVEQSGLQKNMHYNSQVKLTDPHHMRYNFVGLLDSLWDRDFVYKRLLSRDVHENSKASALAKANSSTTLCAIVTPAAYDRVRKLYYEDYAFIDSLARSTSGACAESCERVIGKAPLPLPAAAG
mmetsp:Transcript_43758/g.93125  ORF Transcript_43758/g.93125 Transcript_43758/m.93125 type:complete len:259 (-) Transcript_43758:475-1251(-)